MATTTFESDPLPKPISSGRLWRYLHTGFTLLTSLYVIGLVLYILLRLTLGDSQWWLALLNNFAPYYFLPLFVLLPIALLLRRWDIMARLLLLTLVGGLWFGPYFLPKSSASPTGPTLKIVSFNVSAHKPRIEEITAWLHEMDADMVLLQEIPRAFSENGYAELKKRYPHQFKIPETGRAENLILSRYPLETEEGLDLEGDGWRTHQRITLTVEGQTLAIYNIHLVMPIGAEPRHRQPTVLDKLEFASKYDARDRDAQIARLLPILDAETLPFIVAGDFNMSDQAVIYNELAARMTDSWREMGVGLGRSWPAPGSNVLRDSLCPLIRLDYIWHSDHFRTVEIQQSPSLGSDHLAVVGTLELLTP
jgi:endonuclease/exonuclease/phosphatase (EEP) superfamily protein YafD